MRQNLIKTLTLEIIFHILSFQSNPECQAKRYLCSPFALEEKVCLFIADEQEKWNYMQVCPGRSSCPYETAKYGVNATCQEKNETELQYPGDSCSASSDCLSKNCTSNICQGIKQNGDCYAHFDCDPGLFCNKIKIAENVNQSVNITGTCTPQREFDQPCDEDFECVNNCACSLKKCAFYYSALNGIPADNPLICESGYIFEGKCGAGPISKFKGQPCSADEDCVLVNLQAEPVSTGKCICGYNAGAFSYCSLGTGDSEFSDMLRTFKYITVNNFYCHTARRFGPCEYIYREDLDEYMVAKARFENAPVLTMNDICTAKNINSFYWQYYIGHSYIFSVRLTLIAFVIF